MPDQRIVINTRHGGFGLSNDGAKLYWSIAKSFQLIGPGAFDNYAESRTCPILIYVVEAMGESASSRFSRLKIVDVPEGVKWQIEEYDGREWVAEVHRTWE